MVSEPQVYSKSVRKNKRPRKISARTDEISRAEKLILPGVGHFETGIRNLKKRSLFDTLNEAVLEKTIPILSMCLGIKLMTKFNKESSIEGFGWTKSKKSFENNELKIPHMGWNNLSIKNNESLY